MRTIIDCDKHFLDLRTINEHKNGGLLGVLPRVEAYGKAVGMTPFSDEYPDRLIDPSDYKETVAHCTEEQIFPSSFGSAEIWPELGIWNQNGLNYCWSWGLTFAMMHQRSSEGKEYKELSPVTLGGAVNWRNKGNYLISAMREIRGVGVSEMSYTPDQHSRTTRNYLDGWQGNALLHRVGDAFDTPGGRLSSRLQHMISLLSYGIPLYVAYNWWGHAVMVAGVIWDETQRNNIRVIVGNSHNNTDYIELVGDKAIPDEIIGIASTLTV